jgi:hypothetical protein
MRPDAGTQAQFKKKKEPKKYRYDSSLSPALDWDGRNPAREQAEALIRESLDQLHGALGIVTETDPKAKQQRTAISKAAEAIDKLRRLSKPFLNWAGKAEVPRYEANRGPGSTTDVDFWTSREPREVIHSHLNYVVPDTSLWEQSAAYYIDTHPMAEAFVKNAGLGFSIPYLHNTQMHDYVPDFIVRLKTPGREHLILEIKGYDPLTEVKAAAAARWVAAVNADGSYGKWHYRVVRKPEDVRQTISDLVGQTLPSAKPR